MGLIVVILIILGIAIYEDRRKRNIKQPVETRKPIAYDTRTGIPIYEGEEIIGYNTQTGQPIIKGREEPEKVVKPKEPIDKTKISNSVLMIIGAALVETCGIYALLISILILFVL